jgi:hypothetical protein
MPDNTKVLLPPAAVNPTARRDRAEEHSKRAAERPAENSAAPEKVSRSPRRPWLRRGLFLLLPLALVAGAYWYVTGG